MRNNKTQTFAVNINQDESELISQIDAKLEGALPLLTIRDNVLMPGVVMPVFINRRISISTLKYVEKNGCPLAVFTQKSAESEDFDKDSLMPFGTVANLLHFMQMPDGTYTALLSGLNRVTLLSTKKTPRNGLTCEVADAPEQKPSGNDVEAYQMALIMLKEKMMEICQKDGIPEEVVKTSSG